MAIRVRAEAQPGAMLILRMEEVPAPNPPAKRRVFLIVSLVAVAFVVSLVSVTPDSLGYHIRNYKGPDNMFGDQHLKTAVALIELHKVRYGKYPDSLRDLRFTGQCQIHPRAFR
jgi:hypothetical protein